MRRHRSVHRAQLERRGEMRTHARKPSDTGPERSRSAAAASAQGRLGSQDPLRGVGDYATQAGSAPRPEEARPAWPVPAPSRLGHDFSRISIHPPIAGVVQPKLAIGQPGDAYEQEADRVAERVLRAPESKL